MENKWKRFVALMMSMAMIFMMVPVTVFAGETEIQTAGTNARGVVDRLEDTTLYYPNYADGAVDWGNYHDPSSYVVTVGEKGYVQNLQTFSRSCWNCGSIATEDSATIYAIPELNYDADILSDCSVSLAPYESEDADDQGYEGVPCVQFNFTGKKAGTTRVEFDEYFYVYAGAAYGNCDYCGTWLSFDAAKGWAKVHVSFDVTVKESVIEHELYVPVGYEGEMDFTSYSAETLGFCSLSDLSSSSDNSTIASNVSEIKTIEGVSAAAVTIRGESVGYTVVRVTYMATDSAGNSGQHTEHIKVHVYDPYEMELESGSSDDFIHSIRREGQAVAASRILVDEEPHVISGDSVISVGKCENESEWNTSYNDGAGETGAVSYTVTAESEGTGIVKSVFGYYDKFEDGSQSIHMFVDVLNVTVKDNTPYFYIYHSATGETTKVELTEDIQTDGYDLTEQVTEGCLYGGVYKDQTFADPYTGEDAEEYGNGLTFFPENGETYYLREVDDAYLDIQNLWIKNADGELTQSYLVTVVDGDYYQKVGFAYTESDDFPEDVNDFDSPMDDDKVYSSITVTETKNGKDISSEYTPEEQFGLTGYFAVSNDVGSASLIAVPYWVTQDGIRVTGCEARKLADGRKSKDFTYGSSVSPYEDIGTGMSLLSIQPMFFMGDEKTETAEFVITKYDGDSVEKQNVQCGDNTGLITYAGKANCRFAGWFLDEEYTKAADFTDVSGDMTVYAKYVIDEYLTAKIQTVTSKKIITKLRTTTVTDSKQYAEIGFDYSCGEKQSSVAITTYRTLVSGNRADKFFGGNIPKTAYMLYNDLAVKDLSDGTEITLTPYWITLDGTRVNGTSRTVIYHGNSIELKED